MPEIENGIHIMQSESTNQNWVPGGNPDLIDSSLFTLGVDWLHFKMIKWGKDWDLGIGVNHLPSFDFPTKTLKIKQVATFLGYVKGIDLETAIKIDNFPTYYTQFTDKPLYLIVRYGHNQYWRFNSIKRTSGIPNQYKYMKCEVIDVKFEFLAKDNEYTFSGVVESRW